MKLSKKQATNKIRDLFHEVKDHTPSALKEASKHTGLNIRALYRMYAGETIHPRPSNLLLLANYFTYKLNREVAVEDLITYQKTDNIDNLADQAFK